MAVRCPPPGCDARDTPGNAPDKIAARGPISPKVTKNWHVAVAKTLRNAPVSATMPSGWDHHEAIMKAKRPYPVRTA
jgi:hypothetical protein